MKVQILHLEAHDDRVSVMDRLGWLQTPRALLVWPPGGAGKFKDLDLVLLQRRARLRGTQLGIATTDPALAETARALGYPVFASPEDQPERIWRRSTRRAYPATKPRPDRRDRRSTDVPSAPSTPPKPMSVSPLVRWGLFTGAMLAALATVAYAAPSAEILLAPSTVSHEATLDVPLSLGGDPPAPATVPAVWSAVRVHGDVRIPTTGSTPVGSTAAIGSVVFTNLTDESVEIPLGTGLRAGGTRFVTTAGAVLAPERGSNILVAVQADLPGETGNVDAGAIDGVEGPLGLEVAVLNPQPTQGGGQTSMPAVAAADHRSALETLQSELLAQAEVALRSDLGPGDALVARSRRVTHEFQRAYDSAVGARADSLHLYLDIEVSFLVYSTRDLEALAESALAEETTHVGWVPGSQIVEVEEIVAPAEPAGVRLRITAQARAFPAVDPRRLASQIAGETPDSAVRILTESLDLQSPPVITLRPGILPLLPMQPSRIAFHWPWDTVR